MNDRLSVNGLKVKRTAGWAMFVLLVVTQWEVHPWPLFSLGFFFVLIIWQGLDVYNQPRLWKAVILPGTLLNALAVVANGGRMPVEGRVETYRWWEPLTEHSRLPELCDIYGKSSIGDLFVLTGVIVGIVGYVIQRNRKPIQATA